MEILKLFRKLPSIKILCHCCLQRSLSKGEGCSITQGLGAQHSSQALATGGAPLRHTMLNKRSPKRNRSAETTIVFTAPLFLVFNGKAERKSHWHLKRYVQS